jgi:hypothetical protein
LSSIKKCTSALCMLAYGQAANACDEYYRIGENTSHECRKHFVRTVEMSSSTRVDAHDVPR